MDPVENIIVDDRETLVQGGLYSTLEILALEPTTRIILFSGDVETAKAEATKLNLDILKRVTFLSKGEIGLIANLIPIINSNIVQAS